ncbi:MAG TPA: hypothetical protein VHW70_04925 [Edaphobacter sp.]|nr:hypothetical protein [Edaphobacter sp.]
MKLFAEATLKVARRFDARDDWPSAEGASRDLKQRLSGSACEALALLGSGP